MNIIKHLFPEPEYVTSIYYTDENGRMRYDVSIYKIDKNPYYLDFGDNPTHWEMKIQPQGRFEEEGEVDEWGDMGEPYVFKMSLYSKPPTVEEFSKHMFDECWATIKAMELPEIKYLADNICFNISREDIQPHQVYRFLKEIHKDYTKTENFLKDYDHYRDRIYNNMKFMYGMIAGYGGMFMKSFDFPIGRHFFDFLGIEIYKDNLKEVENVNYFNYRDTKNHKVVRIIEGEFEPNPFVPKFLKVEDLEGNTYKLFDSQIEINF